MEKLDNKTLGYKLGTILGIVLMACFTVICIALTVKFLCFLF